ncbi:MAG: MaoC family dehydratase N-terminal domain-containing protein [Deltaproteobacteria bacterium]|nr:MaoC family dehydratase N-terminal domain-containing protein [Deltaproteobacteria bacterium]
MDYIEEMKKYYSTQKQKDFTPDFLDAKQIDSYEFWDEIQIGQESEILTKFEVKAEDLKAFAAAVPDDNPIFYDEEYARQCGHDGIVAHPLFVTQIRFFLLQGGHGSWNRTPGARNPGQIIEYYDPIKVGDILTLKLTSYDKWIKRGKYYMRALSQIYDQHENLKMRYFSTLILPRTKADVLRFLQGEHALEA